MIQLKNQPAVRTAVRYAILSRAPAAAIAGGKAALSRQLDELLDAWANTADAQTAGGSQFAFARRQSPQRLLHMPLEPTLPNLAPEHRRFTAGRSMRDVEPNVMLTVRDPSGFPIAQADDLQ